MLCSAPCIIQVAGIVIDVKPFVLDGVAHEQEQANRPEKCVNAEVSWGREPESYVEECP